MSSRSSQFPLCPVILRMSGEIVEIEGHNSRLVRRLFHIADERNELGPLKAIGNHDFTLYQQRGDALMRSEISIDLRDQVASDDAIIAALTRLMTEHTTLHDLMHGQCLGEAPKR